MKRKIFYFLVFAATCALLFSSGCAINSLSLKETQAIGKIKNVGVVTLGLIENMRTDIFFNISKYRISDVFDDGVNAHRLDSSAFKASIGLNRRISNNIIMSLLSSGYQASSLNGESYMPANYELMRFADIVEIIQNNAPDIDSTLFVLYNPGTEASGYQCTYYGFFLWATVVLMDNKSREIIFTERIVAGSNELPESCMRTEKVKGFLGLPSVERKFKPSDVSALFLDKINSLIKKVFDKKI